MNGSARNALAAKNEACQRDATYVYPRRGTSREERERGRVRERKTGKGEGGKKRESEERSEV